jgi:hypothetical protein
VLTFWIENKIIALRIEENIGENIMTDTIGSIYEELYREAVDTKAKYAGELAGMAFIAQELLLRAQAGRLDTYSGRKAIEEMENTLREYYQGTGKNSPFARPYAKLTFEDGIEAGMKETV